MLGYWHEVNREENGINSEPDGHPVVNDGWLHTGDLARIAADGLYQIVERKKDLIITGGFNVYPQGSGTSVEKPSGSPGRGCGRSAGRTQR